VVDRVHVDRPLRVEILKTLDRTRDDAPIAYDHQAAAGDPGGLHLLAIEAFH
jgi:hypothetical protein